MKVYAIELAITVKCFEEINRPTLAYQVSPAFKWYIYVMTTYSCWCIDFKLFDNKILITHTSLQNDILSNMFDWTWWEYQRFAIWPWAPLSLSLEIQLWFMLLVLDKEAYWGNVQTRLHINRFRGQEFTISVYSGWHNKLIIT